MRVLIAEDETMLRSALRLWLTEKPGFEVVGEVSETCALFSSLRALQPDVLLLDWELAGLNPSPTRIQVMTSLHRLHPRLSIIGLTSDLHLAGQPLANGADAMVSKMEPPDQLLQALQHVLSLEG